MTLNNTRIILRARNTKTGAILNLAKKIDLVLPKDISALIKKVGRLSDSLGYAAFIVGGLARDLVLGVKNLDIDIVVEGDAIKTGRLLARDLKAAIVVHKKFGTCSVATKNKFKIDIATARTERYEKPAALPTVEFSSLKDDLIRRDFTINAMAISINDASFGRLIDLFNGRRDLARGRIKILHDGSFIDDPTRILRAVRFESRFGFVIERHTEELIKKAIDRSMLDKVEPQRMRDELILMLQDPRPLGALKRLSGLEGINFINSGIKVDSDLIKLYNAIDETCARYESSGCRKKEIEKWPIYLMALFDSLTYAQVWAISNKFVFKGSDRLKLLSCKKHAVDVIKELSEKKAPAPHEIYRLLKPLPIEVILFTIAVTALMVSTAKRTIVRRAIKEFLQNYSGMSISVCGDDLKSMGLKPGPEFAVILKDVLYKKIDGKLDTRLDEIEYARALTRRALNKKRR